MRHIRRTAKIALEPPNLVELTLHICEQADQPVANVGKHGYLSERQAKIYRSKWSREER